MTTRSMGPLAGLRWLKRAINLGHRQPRAVFGGAALLLLMSLLPSLVTLPMQFGAMRAGAGMGGTTMLVVMAVSALAGLLLVPLFAGYLRIIDAAERGLSPRARDLFAPYRQGEALRLIGYGLAMLVVYAAVIAIVLVATGGGIGRWYLQLLAMQGSGQPATVPGLPPNFGLAVALFAVLWLLVMAIYAISLGQVALRGRSVLGAIGDGVVGGIKNVLPLLVFALSLVLAWIVLAIGLVLLFGALTLLGKLVGAWLVIVLAVPLYIALVLVLFVVMFGVVYHLWRDVCGDDAAPASNAQAIAA